MEFNMLFRRTIFIVLQLLLPLITGAWNLPPIPQTNRPFTIASFEEKEDPHTLPHNLLHADNSINPAISNNLSPNLPSSYNSANSRTPPTFKPVPPSQDLIVETGALNQFNLPSQYRNYNFNVPLALAALEKELQNSRRPNGGAGAVSNVPNVYQGEQNTYQGVQNAYQGVQNDYPGGQNVYQGVRNSYKEVENSYQEGQNVYQGIQNVYHKEQNTYQERRIDNQRTQNDKPGVQVENPGKQTSYSGRVVIGAYNNRGAQYSNQDEQNFNQGIQNSKPGALINNNQERQKQEEQTVNEGVHNGTQGEVNGNLAGPNNKGEKANFAQEKLGDKWRMEGDRNENQIGSNDNPTGLQYSYQRIHKKGPNTKPGALIYNPVPIGNLGALTYNPVPNGKPGALIQNQGIQTDYLGLVTIGQYSNRRKQNWYQEGQNISQEWQKGNQERQKQEEQTANEEVHNGSQGGVNGYSVGTNKQGDNANVTQEKWGDRVTKWRIERGRNDIQIGSNGNLTGGQNINQEIHKGGPHRRPGVMIYNPVPNLKPGSLTYNPVSNDRLGQLTYNPVPNSKPGALQESQGIQTDYSGRVIIGQSSGRRKQYSYQEGQYNYQEGQSINKRIQKGGPTGTLKYNTVQNGKSGEMTYNPVPNVKPGALTENLGIQTDYSERVIRGQYSDQRKQYRYPEGENISQEWHKGNQERQKLEEQTANEEIHKGSQEGVNGYLAGPNKQGAKANVTQEKLGAGMTKWRMEGGRNDTQIGSNDNLTGGQNINQGIHKGGPYRRPGVMIYNPVPNLKPGTLTYNQVPNRKPGALKENQGIQTDYSGRVIMGRYSDRRKQYSYQEGHYNYKEGIQKGEPNSKPRGLINNNKERQKQEEQAVNDEVHNGTQGEVNGNKKLEKVNVAQEKVDDKWRMEEGRNENQIGSNDNLTGGQYSNQEKEKGAPNTKPAALPYNPVPNGKPGSLSNNPVLNGKPRDLIENQGVQTDYSGRVIMGPFCSLRKQYSYQQGQYNYQEGQNINRGIQVGGPNNKLGALTYNPVPNVQPGAVTYNPVPNGKVGPLTYNPVPNKKPVALIENLGIQTDYSGRVIKGQFSDRRKQSSYQEGQNINRGIQKGGPYSKPRALIYNPVPSGQPGAVTYNPVPNDKSGVMVGNPGIQDRYSGVVNTGQHYNKDGQNIIQGIQRDGQNSKLGALTYNPVPSGQTGAVTCNPVPSGKPGGLIEYPEGPNDNPGAMLYVQNDNEDGQIIDEEVQNGNQERQKQEEQTVNEGVQNSTQEGVNGDLAEQNNQGENVSVPQEKLGDKMTKWRIEGGRNDNEIASNDNLTEGQYRNQGIQKGGPNTNPVALRDNPEGPNGNAVAVMEKQGIQSGYLGQVIIGQYSNREEKYRHSTEQNIYTVRKNEFEGIAGDNDGKEKYLGKGDKGSSYRLNETTIKGGQQITNESQSIAASSHNSFAESVGSSSSSSSSRRSSRRSSCSSSSISVQKSG